MDLANSTIGELERILRTYEDSMTLNIIVTTSNGLVSQFDLESLDGDKEKNVICLKRAADNKQITIGLFKWKIKDVCSKLELNEQEIACFSLCTNVGFGKTQFFTWVIFG